MLNKIIKNKALWLTVFVCLLTFISWQSLTPKPFNAFAHASDKFLHFAAWFAVGISLLLGINKKFLTACFLLLLYSISIECGQHWIPGRFFSYLDIIANGAGILTAWLIHYLIKMIN